MIFAEHYTLIRRAFHQAFAWARRLLTLPPHTALTGGRVLGEFPSALGEFLARLIPENGVIVHESRVHSRGGDEDDEDDEDSGGN